MNYNKIVQRILDIGESMLISGAENYRIENVQKLWLCKI